MKRDRTRVLMVLASLMLLTGCPTPVKKPDPVPPPPPPSRPTPPADPVPAAPSAPSPAPPPASGPPPLAPGEVPATLRAVQGLLQEGDADAAQALLVRILAVDANNALAQLYLKQIETDPQVLLGRESHAYVVRPGDSLSSIARDNLRDFNLFYALARYNNIKVPRLLAAGQTIRVPGRAAPAPAPAPTPAPTPASTPAPPPPPPPATPPPPPPPPPAAPAVPPEDKARRIATLLRDGRTQFARQDLCASVRSYDKVLELDANHAVARSERQRALDLIDRLRKQGSKLDC